MAITYNTNKGTGSSGTTSLTLGLPIGISVGDVLIASAVNRPSTSTPDTPAGWTLLESVVGGSGADAEDSGTVRTSSWYRIVAGGESDLTVNIPGGTSATGQMISFSRSAGDSWTIESASGSDNTAGTDFSVTADSILGFESGDMIVAQAGTNSNLSGSGVSRSFSATGATFDAVSTNLNRSTSIGFNGRIDGGHALVSAGPATSAVTWDTTYGSSAGNYPAGSAIIIRLAEYTEPTPVVGITYVGKGNNSSGSATASPSLPSGYDTGDIMLAYSVSRPSSITPVISTGWTLLESVGGGSGSDAEDSGNIRTSVWYRVATSNAESAPTLTVAGGTAIVANTQVWTNTGNDWLVESSSGADNTAGTSYLVNGTSTLDVKLNDHIIAVTGTNSNLSGSGNARKIQVPGATIGSHTSVDTVLSSLGFNQRLDTGWAAVISGSATDTPIYSTTFTSSGTNYPAGATALVRIREKVFLPLSANAGQDRTVEPYTQVSLYGIGSGGYGSPIESWSQSAGPAVNLTTDGDVAYFTAPESDATQTYTFKFTVSDDGQSVEDEVIITVEYNTDYIGDNSADGKDPGNFMIWSNGQWL